MALLITGSFFTSSSAVHFFFSFFILWLFGNLDLFEVLESPPHLFRSWLLPLTLQADLKCLFPVGLGCHFPCFWRGSRLLVHCCPISLCHPSAFPYGLC